MYQQRRKAESWSKTGNDFFLIIEDDKDETISRNSKSKIHKKVSVHPVSVARTMPFMQIFKYLSLFRCQVLSRYYKRRLSIRKCSSKVVFTTLLEVAYRIKAATKGSTFFTAYSKIDFTESKYFNFKIPLKYIPVGRVDKKPPLV